jgi:hypothetical protein
MMLNDGLWSGGVGSKASISVVCFSVKAMTADSSGSGVEGCVGMRALPAAFSSLRLVSSKLVRRLVSVVHDMVGVVKRNGGGFAFALKLPADALHVHIGMLHVFLAP